MRKLVGAVLIWSGCAFLGVSAAAGLSRRTRLLEELVRAMEQLERELVLSRLALPELLKGIAREFHGPAAQLFGTCSEWLEREHSFGCAWRRAVEETELQQGDRACLAALGTLLGRFDAEGQGRSVERVRRELEDRAAQAREQQRTLGRVYPMLGVTAGCFLALTLL